MIEFEKPAAAIDIKLVKLDSKVASPETMKFRNVNIKLDDLDRMIADP